MAMKTFNTTLTDELVPVEDFIYTGLEKQWASVFGGSAALVQSTDKKRVLNEQTKGELEYPYSTLTISSIAEVEGRGNVKYAVLHGTPVSVSRDKSTYTRVAFMPVELTVAVEMITNSFQKLSRMVNTWLMARSKGSLHFNVNYGRSSFSIRVTPSPSVSFPERQADNDTVQEYVLSSEVTLMSYISDISTVQTDIVRDVETTLSLGVQGADSQFWSFNRSAN